MYFVFEEHLSPFCANAPIFGAMQAVLRRRERILARFYLALHRRNGRNPAVAVHDWRQNAVDALSTTNERVKRLFAVAVSKVFVRLLLLSHAII
jgi:hypothetical protein